MAKVRTIEKSLSMNNDDFDVFVNVINNNKLDKRKLEIREKSLKSAKKAFSKAPSQSFNFVRA